MCDSNFDFVVKPVETTSRVEEMTFESIRLDAPQRALDEGGTTIEDDLDFVDSNGEIELGGLNLNLDFSHF